MGRETSKAHARRLRDGTFDRYLTGRGLDIGCGDDPITPDCLRWDLPQGDAATLPGLEAESFDWVYSSHCLEDLPDPEGALRRWWEVLKPGGCLLLVVRTRTCTSRASGPAASTPATATPSPPTRAGAGRRSAGTCSTWSSRSPTTSSSGSDAATTATIIPQASGTAPTAPPKPPSKSCSANNRAGGLAVPPNT